MPIPGVSPCPRPSCGQHCISPGLTQSVMQCRFPVAELGGIPGAAAAPKFERCGARLRYLVRVAEQGSATINVPTRLEIDVRTLGSPPRSGLTRHSVRTRQFLVPRRPVPSSHNQGIVCLVFWIRSGGLSPSRRSSREGYTLRFLDCGEPGEGTCP